MFTIYSFLDQFIVLGEKLEMFTELFIRISNCAIHHTQ